MDDKQVCQKTVANTRTEKSQTSSPHGLRHTMRVMAASSFHHYQILELLGGVEDVIFLTHVRKQGQKASEDKLQEKTQSH